MRLGMNYEAFDRLYVVEGRQQEDDDTGRYVSSVCRLRGKGRKATMYCLS